MVRQEKKIYSYVWLCPDCDSLSDRPYCPNCSKKLDFIKDTFLTRFNFSRRGNHKGLTFI